MHRNPKPPLEFHYQRMRLCISSLVIIISLLYISREAFSHINMRPKNQSSIPQLILLPTNFSWHKLKNTTIQS